MDVLKVFDTLYQQYGPQGWWPTVRRMPHRAKKAKRKDQNFLPPPLRLPLGQGEKVLPQYYPGKYGRKLSESEKFEIAIGAILTQNTAWKNVEKVIACLYRERLMSPQTMLDAPIGKLRKCIKSSGYYKQKTKKVKIFCRWLVKKHGGELGMFFEQKIFPPPSEPVRRSHRAREVIESLRRELLYLWGIGQETADSILLYAGGFPIFVVDAYTKKLCTKNGVKFKTYDEYQRFFEHGLAREIIRLCPDCQRRGFARDHRLRLLFLDPAALYQEYHALIVKWEKK